MEKEAHGANWRANITSISQPVNYAQIQSTPTRDSPKPNKTLKATWMLVSLLILGSAAAVLISVLYLKTLQEKRASQVKSLDRINDC